MICTVCDFASTRLFDRDYQNNVVKESLILVKACMHLLCAVRLGETGAQTSAAQTADCICMIRDMCDMCFCIF